MTKILLIRHGHVEGIKPERFRGRQPLPLTERGRAEAQAVAKRVAGSWRPSRIYTSPLGRCIETGAAIAAACGASTEVCEDLTDIDYGAWQFKTFDEARAADPALFAAWFATPHLVRFPGGESLQDLVARAANVLRLMLSRHPDETIVLVGHDSINRALILQLIDQPLSAYWRIAQTPCCLDEIDVSDGKICAQRINETGHLEAFAP
jgi:broad specificity phosphatase PhoE